MQFLENTSVFGKYSRISSFAQSLTHWTYQNTFIFMYGIRFSVHLPQVWIEIWNISDTCDHNKYDMN